MKKIRWVAVFLIWLLLPISTYASELEAGEEQDIQQGLLDEFEFGELESYLDELLPEEKIGFLDMVEQLISGDMPLSFQSIWEVICNRFAYEWRHTRASVIGILILVILAALFHNLSGVLKQSQISEIGFFVLYLLLISTCLESFRVISDSVSTGLSSLLGFLQILSPVYFLAVGIATGSSTSVAFYTMILLLIYMVELVIQSILIPLVQMYLMVRILNHLSPEGYLSKFGELLKTVLVWSLRVLLGAVMGMNLVQGLLNPAIDSVKRSVLTRGGEAIPVIGNLVGGTAEVVLGTAKLIQNGIGAAGAIICVIICLAPVIEMFVVMLLYKLTAALIQPISDKRIVGCISSVADGAELLLRILLTSAILFLITIAMVANATG